MPQKQGYTHAASACKTQLAKQVAGSWALQQHRCRAQHRHQRSCTNTALSAPASKATRHHACAKLTPTPTQQRLPITAAATLHLLSTPDLVVSPPPFPSLSISLPVAKCLCAFGHPTRAPGASSHLAPPWDSRLPSSSCRITDPVVWCTKMPGLRVSHQGACPQQSVATAFIVWLHHLPSSPALSGAKWPGSGSPTKGPAPRSQLVRMCS